MHRSKLLAASVISSAVFLTSCATPPEPGENAVAYNFNQAFNNPNACSNNARNIGILLGAGIGAGIGLLAKGNAVAALEGAAAGGAAGFLVGHLVDNRRCEAYHVAVAHHLMVASAVLKSDQIGEQAAPGQNNTIGTNVIIQDNGQFEPGSAELTPNAQAGLPQIAQQYSPTTIAAEDKSSTSSEAASQRTVLVISRTSGDDQSAESPSELSAQRARTVAKVMADSGVPAQNIYYQGAGDSESIVPSADPSAKAVNNSTQILDFPNQQALQTYLNRKATNPPASVVAKNAAPSAPADQPDTGFGTVGEAQASYSGYDFGGKPVIGAPEMVALGQTNSTPGLSLISSAYAAQPMNIEACVLDHPRHSSPVVNYATGQALSVDGAIPGFYGAPWEGGFNGNLVDALHVYVPSDTGAPVPEPTVEVFKNYHTGMTKANFSKTVPVNVYRSQNKVLYRMFVGGPMKCMDLVVSDNTPQGQGTLYYDHDGKLFTADGGLALQH